MKATHVPVMQPNTWQRQRELLIGVQNLNVNGGRVNKQEITARQAGRLQAGASSFSPASETFDPVLTAADGWAAFP